VLQGISWAKLGIISTTGGFSFESAEHHVQSQKGGQTALNGPLRRLAEPALISRGVVQLFLHTL